MTEQGHIVLERLQAYLDHELGIEDEKLVAGHLAECSDCEREAARLRSLFEEIEALPVVDLGRDLSPAVLKSIRPRRVSSMNMRIIPLFQAASTLVLLGLLWPVIQNSLLRIQERMSAWSIQDWIHQEVDLIQAGLADFVYQVRGWMEGSLIGFEFNLPGWPITAWWLVLAGGFVLWLLGNGFLLRSVDGRSNRG
jgi:hypothetical protein